MTIGYRSKDVIELKRDPFGARPNRSAVIVSSMARPQVGSADFPVHTICPMTTQIDSYGDHDWAVVLDKSADTDGQNLTKDSAVEPWETTPISEKKIETQITRLTDDAMKRIAKAYARMVLDG